MSKAGFRFKQFTIRQDLCAMKVGTDGVLLGAWADAPDCRYILDAGTGAGLIALMLAQRYSRAIVDAIDIDEDACRQAAANVEASPFAGRVGVTHKSLSAYVPSTGRAYDLIVCNPPFFAQSLKSPDARRNTARHADSLPLDGLVRDARRLLSPAGKLALILPTGREDELRAIAVSNSLNVVRTTQVITREGAEPKRLLAELSPDFSLSCRRDTLIIMRREVPPRKGERVPPGREGVSLLGGRVCPPRKGERVPPGGEGVSPPAGGMSPAGYTQAYVRLTEDFYLWNT